MSEAATRPDAIRVEQFWILTHSDYGDMPVDRVRRAVAMENPI